MVIELGLAPDYVLDRMEYYEIEALMEFRYLKEKSSWEQVRELAYITAQVNSSKTITPETIMKFPWDKKIEVVETEEDIRSVMEEMKDIENKLNNR